MKKHLHFCKRCDIIVVAQLFIRVAILYIKYIIRVAILYIKYIEPSRVAY